MALKADVFFNDSIEENKEYTEIIKTVCNECTLGYKDNLSAGVYLTDNSEIQKTNLKFRKINKPTDVLSFPMLEASYGMLSYSELDRDPESGYIILGDVVISVDMMLFQAEHYNHSAGRELAFLTCHGMLHLLGYDHDTPENENVMIEKQENILKKLGYKR